MELTINHLAAYLPYEISAQCDDKNYSDGYIRGVVLYFFTEHQLHQVFLCGKDRNLKDIKLFLKPMSKLTEKEVTDLGFQRTFFSALKTSMKYKNWLKDMPYRLVQYLLSQHYDIFGLIEAGLAVEK